MVKPTLRGPSLPLRSTLPLLAALVVASPARAQTLRGFVLDEASNAPVVTTLVRLVDANGDDAAVAAADSSGLYRLEAPEPGVYRLVAERLGYQQFESPLLEVNDPARVYTLDLLLRPSPLPIRGFSITVSDEQADREIRLMLGVSIASLRARPIRYADIQSHLERGHDLSGLMRWQNIPSMNVFRTVDGPCFTVRRSGCLPVYFNGLRYRQEILDVVPLDMIHTIVLVFPGESIAYLSGAVLLYSEAWLR